MNQRLKSLRHTRNVAIPIERDDKSLLPAAGISYSNGTKSLSTKKIQQSYKYKQKRNSITKRYCRNVAVLFLILGVTNINFLFKALCRAITIRLESQSNTYDEIIWRGKPRKSLPTGFTIESNTLCPNIDLVISHCDSPLDWIFHWASGVSFQSITVFSKCNKPVHGAPTMAKIIRLDNVGRCDHTYAHYIAESYDQWQKKKKKEGSSDNDYILFLKDSDNSNRNHYSRHRTLEEMIQISKDHGFACHEEPSWVWSQQTILFDFWNYKPICRISVYHNWTMLQEYTLDSYTRLRRDDNSQFRSEHGANLGEYAKHIGVKSLTTTSNVVPVCYGGNFLVQRRQIITQSHELWKNIEKSLKRANNIAEGHFAERLWAPLLCRPLQPPLIQDLLSQMPLHPCKADKNYIGIFTK